MQVRRQRFRLRRNAAIGRRDRPGLLCIQIDGLGYDVLRRAIADGGHTRGCDGRETHRLMPWHTDWSSQTGATQLGMLHGRNHNVPAFRWYDKATEQDFGVQQSERQRANASSNARDIPGLLADDGASRGNLFTGGARRQRPRRQPDARRPPRRRCRICDYFVDPASALRTFIRHGRRGAARRCASPAAPAQGHPAAGAPRRDLPVGAGVRDRARHRRRRRRGRRRPHQGPQRDLRRPHRLRRGLAPLRDLPAGDPRGADQTRRRRRQMLLAVVGAGRPARTASSCSPITARARARRSCSATGRPWGSWCIRLRGESRTEPAVKRHWYERDPDVARSAPGRRDAATPRRACTRRPPPRRCTPPPAAGRARLGQSRTGLASRTCPVAPTIDAIEAAHPGLLTALRDSSRGRVPARCRAGRDRSCSGPHGRSTSTPAIVTGEDPLA